MGLETKKRKYLQPEQKALNINLNKKVYGTFAEIGAGQEVARNFFQAGAAAGTIAKTMSAYDKTYSDAIYGVEKSGRYVCESRLYKMLDHEYSLLVERLDDERPETCFFAFADTVAAINYKRTIKGHGWIGLRFQLTPNGPPNDLIIHVKLKDQNTHLQQEAIGVLGVNMLYAVYKYHDDMNEFVASLVDGISGRLSVDMLRLEGPDFDHVDNRLLSLYLVKHDLTDVAIFSNHKRSIHASEFLWKKDLLVVRGHYKPFTNVTMDVYKSGMEQFIKEPDVTDSNSAVIAEITMEYLRENGDDIDEKDFLDRTEAICALGYNVIISDCNNHQALINYLAEENIGKLGLVVGVRELSAIIEEKYHNNQDGRLLVAFGELFNRNINVYVYPAIIDDKGLVTARTLIVPEGIHFLYKHLIDCKQIVEIENYDGELLKIFPWNVLEEIKQGVPAWENSVPKLLAPVIKEKSLFDYASQSPSIA